MTERSSKHTKAGTQLDVSPQTGKCREKRNNRPRSTRALYGVEAEKVCCGDLIQASGKANDDETDIKTTDASLQDEPTYEYLEFCESDRGLVVKFKLPGIDTESLTSVVPDNKNDILVNNDIVRSERVDPLSNAHDFFHSYDSNTTGQMMTERSYGRSKSGKDKHRKPDEDGGGDLDGKADDDGDDEIDVNADNAAADEDTADNNYRMDDDGDKENDGGDDKPEVTGDDSADDNGDDDGNNYTDDNAACDDDNVNVDHDTCNDNISGKHANDSNDADYDDSTDNSNETGDGDKSDNNVDKYISEAGARTGSTAHVPKEKDNVDFKLESNGKTHKCNTSIAGAYNLSVAITRMAHDSIGDDEEEDSNAILTETPNSFKTIISVSKEAFTTDIAVNECTFITEYGIRKDVNEDDTTRNTGDTEGIEDDEEEHNCCCCLPFPVFRKKRKQTRQRLKVTDV